MQTVSELVHRSRLVIALVVVLTLAAISIYVQSAPAADPVEFAIAANADLVHGAAVFETNCAGCHLNGGNIIRRGQNLKAPALQRNHIDSIEAVSAIVIQGKGIMSAYGDKLSDDDVRDVASYVLDRANANWEPSVAHSESPPTEQP